MLTRREWLKLAAGTAVGAAVPGNLLGTEKTERVIPERKTYV